MSEKSSGVPGGSSDRRAKLRKLAMGAGLAVVVVGVALQFVPVEGIGTNPTGDRYVVKAPPEVEAILRRSCFDCHTNETAWPIYARIAPGSWLIARDVKKGRSRMNMSEWSDDDRETQELDKENSWDQIEAGDMPPWFYLPMHPNAYLSDKEKALLKGWLLAHKQPGAQTAAAGGDKPAAEKPAAAASP